MMRYWPSASVTAVRTFSIRAGLAASTVTPGRTAPEASLTTPAMPDAVVSWAHAVEATITKVIQARLTSRTLDRAIGSPPFFRRHSTAHATEMFFTAAW